MRLSCAFFTGATHRCWSKIMSVWQAVTSNNHCVQHRARLTRCSRYPSLIAVERRNPHWFRFFFWLANMCKCRRSHPCMVCRAARHSSSYAWLTVLAMLCIAEKWRTAFTQRDSIMNPWCDGVRNSSNSQPRICGQMLFKVHQVESGNFLICL